MHPQTDRKPEHRAPPEGSPEEVAWARRRAWRATWRIVLPFLLAVAMVLGERAYGVHLATAALAELARSVCAEGQPRVEAPPTLANRLAEKDWDRDMSDRERQRFKQSVRTVVRELRKIPPEGLGERFWLSDWTGGGGDLCHARSGPSACGPDDLRAFCRITYDTMLRNAWFPAAVQAIWILLFPALFISSFWRAVQGIEKGSALARDRLPTFSDAVWYRRYRAFLAEQDNWYFWRRAAFAFQVGYGLIYLLSPLGTKAMVIGEYAALHGMAGEASYPFLFTAVREALPFTYGFAGFFLYSLTVFVRRFVTHDLNDRVFVPLFIRAITVLLLSGLLSTVGEQGLLSNALVFAAGVFPQAGLSALAKLTQTTVDRISNESNTGFRHVPEIDFWKEATLQDVGVNDYNDLARADLDELLTLVGINPALLLRAADRALLVHTLGPDAAARLAAIPLFTASELVLYLCGRDAYAARWPDLPEHRHLMPALAPEERALRKARVEKVLAVEDICLQLDQLGQDRNVRTVIDNRVGYGLL